MIDGEGGETFIGSPLTIEFPKDEDERHSGDNGDLKEEGFGKEPNTGGGENDDGGDIGETDDEDIVVSESDGTAVVSGLNIVMFVTHGINSIISENPEPVGEDEAPCKSRRRRMLNGGKSDQYPESEGDTEYSLRKREESFSEGIKNGECKPNERPIFGESREQQP